MQRRKAFKVCGLLWLLFLSGHLHKFEWCMKRIEVKNGTKNTSVTLRLNFVLNIYALTINEFGICY